MTGRDGVDEENMGQAHNRIYECVRLKLLDQRF